MRNKIAAILTAATVMCGPAMADDELEIENGTFVAAFYCLATANMDGPARMEADEAGCGDPGMRRHAFLLLANVCAGGTTQDQFQGKACKLVAGYSRMIASGYAN